MPLLYHNNNNEQPVAFAGSSFIIACQTELPYYNIKWYLNGKEYINGSDTNILIRRLTNTLSALRFNMASTSMNETSIMCSVDYDMQCTVNSSEVVFLVQGKV